ncbi:hypothetical protein AAG570_006960 [Ranatra chinensis]|uniref:Insulin receptor substrate 1 n=1 Tax=Ranatra chinensis TaxID=642074 RepID=A0ABD0YVK9_9HEMI
MRKKYFVLRGDSGDTSKARLEYYDSEKKWKANHAPKRSIILKNCFNINKRTDIKNKWVIALYTRKDCFCIVLDNEEELESWLKSLLELQLGIDGTEGEPIKPTFEHVWRVTVLDKELGGRAGILGPYHLCLTDQTLSLVKIGTDDKLDTVEFSLQKIRRCGSSNGFFYMEVGQCTVTGPGNLWMQTEDANIAENMKTTILSAWRNCAKKENQPKSRNRSSSANETSKPISFMQRWPTHSGSGGSSVNHQRTYSFPLSPLPPTRRASTGTRPTKCTASNFTQPSVRERCDSLPCRARTTSEGAPHLPHPPRIHHGLSHSRPHSMYNRVGISYSPPVGSSPVSPASGACSTDSAGSSLSMDGETVDGIWETEGGRFVHSPEEPAIMEENSDDYWQAEDEKLNNNVNTERSLCLPIQSATSLNNVCKKHSPNTSSGFKSSSPSQGSYMEMCSPCSSSPLDTPGNYIPMSPGKFNGCPGSANHSQGSSLAEEGYVHMAPVSSEDAYVDMDQRSHHRSRSSCSITSGTASTDPMKFSEYTLDKVTSYFPPDEDIAPAERPTRAYSVGSRPVNNNARREVFSQSDCERVRAFSLGSHVRFLGQVPFTKNPQFLSSSHSSMEPSDDMMEIDFSKKGKQKSRKKQLSAEKLSVPIGGNTHFQSTNTLLGKSPPKPVISECPFTRGSPPVSGYPSPSLGRVPEAEPGYMDMTSGPKESFPSAEAPRLQHFPKSSSPPIKQALLATKGSNDDYLDMSLKRKTSVIEDNNNSKIIVGHSDEYVEMNMDSEANYLNMSIKKERKSSRKDRNRYSSQPITIQPVPKDSGSPIFAVSSRKHSTGTPPKIPSFLPLGSSNSPNSSPHSTLDRNRQRKNSVRRDSKDAGSGFITPTGSSGTIFPFSLNSPLNSPGGYESSPKCPVDATSGTPRIICTLNRPESQTTITKNYSLTENKVSDYVNYQPGKTEESDYISMQSLPTAPESSRKISAPSVNCTKLRPMEKLLTGLGSLTVSSPAIITVPPVECISESDCLVSASNTSRLSEDDQYSSAKGENKSVSRTSSISSMG